MMYKNCTTEGCTIQFFEFWLPTGFNKVVLNVYKYIMCASNICKMLHFFLGKYHDVKFCLELYKKAENDLTWQQQTAYKHLN